MSRLIDAEVMREKAYQLYFGLDITEREMFIINNLIDKQPTVEPRKGKWIENEDEEDTVVGRCSNCGWESYRYEDDVFGMPYCPNCGASMVRGNSDD